MIVSTVLVIQFLPNRVDGFPMNPNPLMQGICLKSVCATEATIINKVLF